MTEISTPVVTRPRSPWATLLLLVTAVPTVLGAAIGLLVTAGVRAVAHLEQAHPAATDRAVVASLHWLCR